MEFQYLVLLYRIDNNRPSLSFSDLSSNICFPGSLKIFLYKNCCCYLQFARNEMILQTPPAAARALCSHEFYLQPPLQACRSWRAPRQHCPAGSSRRPGRRVPSWCSGSTTSPSLPSTRNYFTRPQHYRLLMTRTLQHLLRRNILMEYILSISLSSQIYSNQH